MNQSVTIRDTEITVADVLRKLSEGYGFEQVLKAYPSLTLIDILASLQLAADILEQHITAERMIQIEGTIMMRANNGRVIDLTSLRKEFPRAFEKWETAEDNRLVAMYKDGVKVPKIAEQLGRQEGAVRVRLRKLELTK